MNKHILSVLTLIALLMSATALPASAARSERDLTGALAAASPPSDAGLGPNAATFPYADGFESGTLGADWSQYTTEDGRVRVSSDYPHAGSYSLLLDDSASDTTYSVAAAILTRSSDRRRPWCSAMCASSHMPPPPPPQHRAFSRLRTISTNSMPGIACNRARGASNIEQRRPTQQLSW